MNPFYVLVGTAGLLAVVSLLKPTWPLVPVAVILLCAAVIIKKKP